MQTIVPLPMALMDFLPNLIFLLGVYWLFRCGYRSGLFLTGSTLVFLNGMTKALWKLIVALHGPDIAWLAQIFVVLLSTGFLLMFIAAWQRLHANARLTALQEAKTIVPAQNAEARHSLPVIALAASMDVWKIPFMVLALVGAVGLYSVLIAAAWKSGRRRAVIAFAIAMLLVIVMSGLAGGDFNLARQWTAQTVNLFAQGAFAVGAFLLERACSGAESPCWDVEQKG